MSLGLILVIILIIFLVGGFSGRFGGYGYGYGHGGVGLIGTILIIIVHSYAAWTDLTHEAQYRMSRLRLRPESHLVDRIGWLRAAVLGGQ